MIGKCFICSKEGKVVKHHVNYFPEQLQQLCYSCHKGFHKNGTTSLHEEYKEFNPIKVKQIWISDEAYEYVRKSSFDSRKPMGKLVSEAILYNVSDQE